MPGKVAQGLAYLLLGQPALAQALSRALATKGEQPQYLEGRFSPTVTALDLTEMEYRWAMRRVTYQHRAQSPAVAGQISMAVLFGPPQILGVARQAMTVLESIIVNNATAANLGYLFATNFAGAAGLGAGATAGRTVDDRAFGSVSASTLAVGANAVNPLVGLPHNFLLLAPGTSAQIRGPWILSGKDNAAGFTSNFLVGGDQSNTAIDVSFRWYEREMMAGES